MQQLHDDGVPPPADPMLDGFTSVVGAVQRQLRRQGPGGTVLVTGPSGGGRTSVADAVAAAAIRDGFVVRRTVAVQRADGRRVLRLPHDADAVIDDQRPGVPVPADLLLPDHPRGRAALVVDDLLVEAATSPVLVVVDPLEQLDAATTIAVQHLVEALDAVPVTLVATTDGPEGSESLASMLATRPDTTVVPLPPLSPAATQQVATVQLAAPPGPRLLAALARCRGNLRVILWVIALAIDEGLLVDEDGLVELAPGVDLPSDAAGVVRRRLSHMDPQDQAMLRLAAVLGERFGAGELAAVAHRRVADLVPTLQRASAAGLLRDEGPGLAFTAPAVRTHLLSELPAGALPALHREAGQALLASGLPVMRAAGQFLLAGQDGDAQAVGALAAAGRQLALHEPSEAVAVLREAVRLDGGRDELLMADLASSLSVAGAPTEAEQVARRALASAATTGARWALGIALARSLYAQGRPWESVDVLRAALPEAPDRAAHARVTADIVLCRALSGDLAGAENAAAEVEGAVGSHPVATAVLGITRSIAASVRGDAADGLAHARQALATARTDQGRPAALYTPGLFVAMGLANVDQIHEAKVVLADARADAQRAGVGWTDAVFESALAQADWWVGDLRAVDARVATALPGLCQHPAAGGPVLAAIATMVALARGDVEQAQRHLAAGETIQAALPLVVSGAEWLAAVRPLVLAAEGQTALALEQAKALWGLLGATGYRWGHWTFGPSLARLAIIGADPDFAADVAEGVEAAAARIDTASARGDAQGVAALVRGDADLAVAAVDEHGRGPRRLQTALWQRDAAILLHRAGRSAEAAVLADQAASTFDDCDAPAYARGLPRRGRKAAAEVWSGALALLTPAQRQVALLVAEGMSNPEIAARLHLSRNTVETHVKAALRRTGTSSRAALAASITRDRRH